MKIEKLTDNKIRIIINIEEIAEHKAKFKKSPKKSQDTAFINLILDEARKQVGFDVHNCKLLIDAFSTTDDYVVFTLTKYKNVTSGNKTKLKNKHLHIADSKNAIYRFNKFDEFCDFCTYCNDSNLKDLTDFAKSISLYEYKGFYYLMLFKINSDFKDFNLFYATVSEFSSWVSDSFVLKSKLLECGNPVFKANAVRNCIKYFSASKF